MNAAHRWPVGLGLVLALTIAGNVVVYRLATRRDARAIEPDYYRKAVAWDSTQAVAARSRALGWRLEATLGGAAAARADERLDTALAETAPGRYALALPVAGTEWLEVRVTADRAGGHFVQRLRCLPGRACSSP